MDDNELQREKIPDADDYKWDLETFHQAVFAAEKALTKPPFKASIVTFPASLLRSHRRSCRSAVLSMELKAAGIPKHTPKVKLDFHAC